MAMDVVSRCSTTYAFGSASPGSNPTYATWAASKRKRADMPVAPLISLPKICMETG